MSLRIDGTFRRGDLRLDLDLAIPAGTTAIVGANGSGKTSLLRLIAGLDALDTGRMTIDGTLVDEPALGHFIPPEHRPVSVAFQQARLFPHMRVLGNIAYPLRRRRPERRPLGADDAGAIARRYAERVGVDHLLTLRPDQLSGGQAQRVSLARALAAGSDTLLLDEPLAAIDDDGRTTIRRVLHDLDAPRVVWVTHDPTDTVGADRIISISGPVVDQTEGLHQTEGQ